jgi:MFS family permease
MQRCSTGASLSSSIHWRPTTTIRPHAISTLLTTLRTRNLLLLMLGRLVSSSGDWLYTVGISVAMYRYSGNSSIAVGMLFLVRMVPYVLLGSLSGALAGRLGYRRAMITADLGRMLAVLLLALLLSPGTWGSMYPLVFIVSCFTSLFRPASVGIIPSLVRSSDELLSANATLMQADNIALLLGSLIGGIVASRGDVTLLLVIQALTFGVSAASLLLIQPRTPEPSEAEQGPEAQGEEKVAGYGGWMGGVRLITERPVLVFVVSIIVIPELVSGAVIVWITPFSYHALHLGNAGVGYLFAALGAGSILGGFVAAASAADRPLDIALVTSVAGGGLALAIFGATSIAAVALVAIAVLGAAETVEFAVLDTLVQKGIPERLIGVAMGSIMSLCMILMLAGNVVSGVLTQVPGLRPSIVGLGVLTIVIAFGVWWNYRRQLARLPSEQILMTVPAFAALPSTLRTWALQRMERQIMPASAVLMRQGERGDRLYVLAEGRARVDIANEQGIVSSKELDAGQVIGEIALLHDVPRTATVTALTPLVAYSLSREDVSELQARAAEFRESLLEMANSRLEYQGTLRTALAARS